MFVILQQILTKLQGLFLKEEFGDVRGKLKSRN
jgi:hypothetical protein